MCRAITAGLFPDFVLIADFKDQICSTIEEYYSLLTSLKTQARLARLYFVCISRMHFAHAFRACISHGSSHVHFALHRTVTHRTTKHGTTHTAVSACHR